MANPVAAESSGSSSRPAGAEAELSQRGARTGKDGPEDYSLSMRSETRNIYSGKAPGEGGLGKAGDDGAGRGQRGANSGVDDPAAREGERRAAAGAEGGGWYSVSPPRGVLLPGEKLEIRFTALVSEVRTSR